MFQRRHKQPFWHRCHEVIWPRMGWRRFFLYLKLRAIRLNATNHQIAVGLACGASISFVPLPGTHIIGAALISMALRGNALASVLGTLIGTPWTFPLMWWMAYKVGVYTYNMMDITVAPMPSVFEWHDFLFEVEQNPFALLVPWVVGGVILALILWPLFYLTGYRFIQAIRHHHQQRKLI